FEEWGIDCLHRFRGMFAFGLWDAHRRELWLVRDRIGIKPLYYSTHNGRLVFASEIKALLRDPDQRRSVHEESFFHFLSFLTTSAPQTLFDGIHKLPGGTWLRIREDGQITEQRYWDVLDHVSPLIGVSEDEIAQCILDELRTAVSLRKVSDVPVGVFLSGGIDSSTNAALFSEGETGTIKTFTIGYQGTFETYQNEMAYARLIADQVGAEYHERMLSLDDLIDFLPEMVRLQDEPIADPVCVPVYYVSKLARENGVIVCQVGEGADELFWGYPSWRFALTLQKYDDWPMPRLVKRVGLAVAQQLGKGHTFYYEYLRRGSLDQPIFWGGAEAFTDAQKRRILSPRLRQQFANLTSWEAIRPIHQRFMDQAWEQTPLQWMTYLDLNLRLPELLLMRVDKMSMGVGLEARVPFLDHKLVELAMSIPQSVKTQNGTLKHILKQSVRGLIPDAIIDRPKQGFGVPVFEWFHERLGDSIRRELSDFCDQTDFLDRDTVIQMADGTPGRRQSESLWVLFNFALWWKHYV
ncbi:MAG TPA: asparagine synthase (glutamine-hydrolyzing), partial [Aggregatilineaceae bacterium]|nr:asparagine synthase (glutamine-hydrolyzing) [Aggregatilineaceae bacterium]